MKDLKPFKDVQPLHNTKYGAVKARTLLATFVLTAIACLNAGAVHAQTSSDQSDTETCQALDDSTALDQESIDLRIACYSRDVQQLNQLVEQLVSERKQLLNSSEDNSTTIENYRLELAQRQTSMQRLEQRASALSDQIDAITADRNQMRNQLFSILSEGKDRPVALEANERLFRSFSRSYVSQSEEIEELKRRLDEFESQTLALTEQQTAAQTVTEQLSTTNATLEADNKALQDQITGLEQSLIQMEAKNSELENNLADTNSKLKGMRDQLIQNAEISEQQFDQIEELKTALSTSEAQREQLEEKIRTLNEGHLTRVTALNSKALELNQEIDTLKQQQLALEEQSQSNIDAKQSTVDARNQKILELAKARLTLNKERAELITKVTALEDDNLRTSLGFQDQVRDLKTEITTLQSEKDSLTTDLQDQQASNANLKEAVRNSEEQNTAMTTAAVTLKSELEQANTTAAELQNTVDQLKQQSDTEQEEFTGVLAELNANIEQTTAERDRLSNELNTVKPQLQQAQESLQQANENNDALSTEVTNLTQRLTSEQDNLKAAAAAAEEERTQMTERLASLNGDTDTLKSLLAMSQAHSKNADKTLTELRTELSASDNRLSERQKQLAELEAERTQLENRLQANEDRTNRQANAIETAMKNAGHDEVKITVADDQSIGILLGSGQLFNTGSSALSAKGQEVLTDLAQTFEQTGERRIMINGHSDNVPLGPKLSEVFGDNWGLSRSRALATADFLSSSAGISADKLTVSGAGATQPIASNDTEEGRQQNRRVEIRLTPIAEAPLLR